MLMLYRPIIFIRIPRTASKSVATIVDANNGYYCLGAKHPWFNVPSLALWNPETTTKEPYYCNVERLKKQFSPQIWNTSLKFTIVRNPWDRVVSMFHHSGIKEQIGNMKFSSFCERLANPPLRTSLERHHTAPLMYQLVLDGKFIPDIVLRFETLRKDFENLCDRLRWPHKKLPHFCPSKREHYREYYTHKTKKIVAKIYKEDIAYFKYHY
jgi:hypothetical protein